MHKNHTEEEFKKYAEKKLGMFCWYYSFNEFLENAQSLCIFCKKNGKMHNILNI